MSRRPDRLAFQTLHRMRCAKVCSGVRRCKRVSNLILRPVETYSPLRRTRSHNRNMELEVFSRFPRINLAHDRRLRPHSSRQHALLLPTGMHSLLHAEWLGLFERGRRAPLGSISRHEREGISGGISFFHEVHPPSAEAPRKMPIPEVRRLFGASR